MLVGRLRPLWFFAAFAIGLLACYVLAPAPDVIIKFPSPYNAGKVTYKDSSDTCFTYTATEVSCNDEGMAVRPQPVADHNSLQ